MIGHIRGILFEKQPPCVVVDVQGVGYEIHVPMTTLYQLPPLKEMVTLLTYHAVSENAQTLYGFYSRKDRELFRTLIKVSGVGPKMALGILSGMEADELVRCIMENNISALVKVPGVGRKTAERLIVETRDRLQDWYVSASPLAALEAAGMAPDERAPALSDIIAEAESALVALGYKPVQATKMIAAAQRAGATGSSEALIRLALRSAVPA